MPGITFDDDELQPGGRGITLDVSLDQLPDVQLRPMAPPPGATVAEEEKPKRKPIEAGVVSAYGQIRYGLPLALETAAGRADPEKVAKLQEGLAATQAKSEELLPGGPMGLGELADNPLGFGRFLGENLGYSLPRTGATIAGAAGGALAGGAVAGAPGAVAGGVTGAVVAGSPGFVGENVERSLEDGELTQDEAGRSLLIAPAQAGADALVGHFIPGVGKIIPGIPVAGGSLAGRVATGTAGGAATEGVTEALQSAGTRYAAGQDLLSPEAGAEYATAGVTGGLLGGAMGAGGAVLGRNDAPSDQQPASNFDPNEGIGGAPGIPTEAAPTFGFRAEDPQGDLFIGAPEQRAEPSRFARMLDITGMSESGNRERDENGNLITSPKGAQGKMQVMPGTNLDPGFGVVPARDGSDAERTRVGRDYLAAMLKRYGGDPAKAWAAYNAGPGRLDSAIEKHGSNWLAHMPEETQKYVAKNVAQLGGAGPVTAAATDIRVGDDLPDPLQFYDAGADAEFSQALITGELRDAFGGPTDTDVAKTGRALTIAFEQADPARAVEYLDAQQKSIDSAFNALAKKQAEIEETAGDFTMAEQAGRMEKIDAELGKLVRRQNMVARGREIVGRWEQANLTQPELPLSGQAPAAPPLDPADPAPVGGAPAGAAMQIEGNPRTARERTVEAVRPFLTDPEPDPVTPPAMPAADTELARQLTNEAAEESIRQNPTRERLAILEAVLNDPETRRPMQRFVAELARKGHSADLTAAESQAIADYEQRQAETTLGVPEAAGYQPQTPRAAAAIQAGRPRQPSGPAPARPFELTRQTEADVEAQTRAQAKRERKAGRATELPPGDANGDLFEEADRIARENVRKRAEAQANTLGSTKRNWFLKGARAALGESDGNPPVGKTQTRSYQDGQAFVERELGVQREERGVAPDAAPAQPAVAEPAAAAPAPAPQDTGAANPDPAPAAKAFRGSKKQALARAVEAEQKGEITAQTGQIIRTMADMEDVKAPELWDLIDAAIANKGEVAPTSAARIEEVGDDTLVAERGKMKSLLETLKREMAKAGLHDVGLEVTSRLAMYINRGDRRVGEYDFDQIIRIAYDQDNAIETLDHEIIHALRDMGLFTASEWRQLQVAVMAGELKIDGRPAIAWARRNYPQLAPEPQVEEAIAEAYAQWRQGQPMGRFARLLRKVLTFFKTLHRAFTGEGYNSAEEIFRAIEAGQIGGRPRGVTGRDIREIAGVREPTDLMPTDMARVEPVKRLPKNLQPHAKSIGATLKEAGKKSATWTLFTEDLANMAAKVLPVAKDFIELNSRNHALSRRFAQKLADIKREYEKLPAAMRGKGPGTVNRYLYDSRMARAWGFQPEYLTRLGKTVKIDPAMKAKFDALPKPAQDVIRAVYQYNHDARREMLTAINATINAEFDELIAKATGQEQTDLQKAKVEALKDFSRLHAAAEDLPYSPLKRSGNWVVVGMSQEYRDAKAAGDQKRMSELRGDEDHYYVDFRETVGQAAALKERMAGKFGAEGVMHFESDSVDAEEIGGNELFMAFGQLKAKVAAAMNKDPSDPELKKLHRMATDLYLHSLSETSARKSELKADMVSALDPFTGEAIDMMRSFVTRGEATTHFVASVSNAPEMYAAIERMREAVTDVKNPEQAADRQRFRNELMRRYVATLNRQPSRLADRLTRFASLWQLLLQPFYYVQNATQPVMLSLPAVAADVGYDKAAAAFTKAYQDISPLVKQAKADERIDLRGVPDDVKDVVDFLLARGRLDAGLSMDLGSWETAAEGTVPRVWNVANRVLAQLPQNLETVNRVVTGMAAYRTHLAKHGDKAAAQEFASKVIYETHGDYSGFNTPAVMGRGGAHLGRIVLQFRKFQLIMASHFGRMVHNSFTNADLTPAERRVARRMLAFTLAHSVATTGIVGFPGIALFATVALWALDSLDGEKDDYDNWEKELDEILGEGFLADLLKKGAPYAALNMDVSGKLGFGNMLSIAPYGDADKALQGREQAERAVGQFLAGPLGTIGFKMIDAGAYLREGDVYRFVEQMLPNGPEDVMKAMRYADRGITKRSGDVLLPKEELGPVDLVYAALGLSTQKLAERAQASGQTFEATEHYKGLTTTLKRRYVNAYDRGDTAELEDVRQRWKEVQEARRKDGFKVQPMGDLLKSVKERARRERRTAGGVQYTPANRGFVEEMADDAD